MLLQKGVLCLQENLYMFRILLAQSKLVLQPVTCITLLMRNFMKSEVNIQAMPGVLIDIILIFFLDRVFIIHFLEDRAYLHFHKYCANYNQFNVLGAATI